MFLLDVNMREKVATACVFHRRLGDQETLLFPWFRKEVPDLLVSCWLLLISCEQTAAGDRMRIVWNVFARTSSTRFGFS